MSTKAIRGAAAVGIVCLSVTAEAQLVIETATVGNLGNPGEWSGEGYGGYGPDRICGAVDQAYIIGRFEVTAGQYTEFLNAMAVEDPYELYNVEMWVNELGCGIERTGSPGSYSYSVAGEWADRPVTWVSWGDAARFCNWLHNGQPTWDQDSSATEHGAYNLNGAQTQTMLMAVTREPDAMWMIPSEDEWYKAAYHYNDGPTADYYDYPTGTDSIPSNDLIDPDPGNNATFTDVDSTIGSPYYRTVVGAHENSDSPYGTHDQGGNVYEWTEDAHIHLYRVLRGGSFLHFDAQMHAAYRTDVNPTYEFGFLGFRVAGIEPPPIPTLSEWSVVVMTLLVLAAATVVLLRRRVAT